MTSPISDGRETSTEELIQNWLITQLAKYLDVDPDEIDSSQPFADYGLDSSVAISLTVALGEWVGDEFQPMLFWEYPSIDALSQYLAKEYSFPQLADPNID